VQFGVLCACEPCHRTFGWIHRLVLFIILSVTLLYHLPFTHTTFWVVYTRHRLGGRCALNLSQEQGRPTMGVAGSCIPLPFFLWRTTVPHVRTCHCLPGVQTGRTVAPALRRSQHYHHCTELVFSGSGMDAKLHVAGVSPLLPPCRRFHVPDSPAFELVGDLPTIFAPFCTTYLLNILRAFLLHFHWFIELRLNTKRSTTRLNVPHSDRSVDPYTRCCRLTRSVVPLVTTDVRHRSTWRSGRLLDHTPDERPNCAGPSPALLHPV